MHLKILFIFCILAITANVSLSAPASPNFSQQSTRPVTPDDIVGQKSKSQKLADGPGVKQDTVSKSKSIKTPKEIGQRSFSVRENAIKTPLPNLRALLKPFRSCSSGSASAVHVPTTTKKDKGKAPATSSSP